jgi:hypothetical protein
VAEISRTVTIRLSSEDVKVIIARHISNVLNQPCTSKDIKLDVSGGGDYGHGYGYVSPSFNYAELTVKEKVK